MCAGDVWLVPNRTSADGWVPGGGASMSTLAVSVAIRAAVSSPSFTVVPFRCRGPREAPAACPRRCTVRASACTAASDPPIVRLWLVCDQASVVIHVWDSSSQMPGRRDAGPDSEGGRGLLVIDALSRDWGAYRKDRGKVAWAMISRAHSLLNPVIRKAR
jgi:hypothetical protein